MRHRIGMAMFQNRVLVLNRRRAQSAKRGAKNGALYRQDMRQRHSGPAVAVAPPTSGCEPALPKNPWRTACHRPAPDRDNPSAAFAVVSTTRLSVFSRACAASAARDCAGSVATRRSPFHLIREVLAVERATYQNVEKLCHASTDVFALLRSAASRSNPPSAISKLLPSGSVPRCSAYVRSAGRFSGPITSHLLMRLAISSASST
jgi:hypothetical protein